MNIEGITRPFFTVLLLSGSGGWGCSHSDATAFTLQHDALHEIKIAAASKDAVFLGESIHLTDDFPRVRMPLLRVLHETSGYATLATEGSVLSAWLAQEHLYQRNGDEGAKAAMRQAWFPLWQTTAMHIVMSYLATSQRSDRPLYLTSFDVQPPCSPRYKCSYAAATRELGEILTKYDGSRPQDGWQDALTSLALLDKCWHGPGLSLKDKSRIWDAVRFLEAEIGATHACLANKRNALHANILSLVPSAIGRYADICHFADRPLLYQQARDRENAAIFREIVELVGPHKVVGWAHHAHTIRNRAGRGPVTMMQELERLGLSTYNVGSFAGSGECLSSGDGTHGAYAVERLRLDANKCYFEHILDKALQKTSFFTRRHMASLRLEDCSVMSSRNDAHGVFFTIPIIDFDAVLYVPHVKKPTLMDTQEEKL